MPQELKFSIHLIGSMTSKNNSAPRTLTALSWDARRVIRCSMSMRYLIRRQNAAELSDVSSVFPDLEQRLDRPAENLERLLTHVISPARVVSYKFFTKKTGSGWAWVCPSVEVVGETEEDILALCEHFQVSKSKLTHICGVVP
jgi:hypothetical protein